MAILSIALHIIVGAVLIFLGIFMAFFEGEYTPKVLPILFAILTMAVFGESAPGFFGLDSMETLVFPIMVFCVLQMIFDSERFLGAIIGFLFIIAGLMAFGIMGPGLAVPIAEFFESSGSFILMIIFAPMFGFLLLFLL